MGGRGEGEFLKQALAFPGCSLGSSHVVPKQFALTLIHCLTKLIAEFEQAETKDAIAALTTDGYEMVKPGAKRLRKEA